LTVSTLFKSYGRFRALSKELYMLDSIKKIRFYFVGAILLVASACVVEAPQPDLGLCSVPPEDRDVWEYGEIGIGSCLASPSDMRVVVPDPSDPENYFLLVANSNSRANFSGSSMLSIDASSIDFSCPANGLHELATDSLEMREYIGRFDFDENTGLGLVTSRYSGGFEGDEQDAMFVVDFSDLTDLKFSDQGPRETGPFRWMRVPRDPWSVRINPDNGRAYVLSLIHHTVSAVDLLSDPLEIIDLYGERATSPAVFEDVDGSGSAPDFTLLGVNDAALHDETLTLTYVVGTTRLYYPGEDGDGPRALLQADSGNGVDFFGLSGGPVLRPSSDWSAEGFGAAAIAADSEGLFGLLEGHDSNGVKSIGFIESSEQALNWAASSVPALSPSLGDWDSAGVFHPDWIASSNSVLAFYTGGEGVGEAIGRATGSTLSVLERSGDPALGDASTGLALEPSAAGWDAGAVFGPSVLVHGDTGEYHLYYGGHADLTAPMGIPSGTAIGLAVSVDGVSFERRTTEPVLSPGEVGSWDSEAVAFPSVFYDNGRFQMWYQGWDGNEWATGRAVSVDGRSWSKDPANPVFEGVFDAADMPTRAFAFKASPGGYYRIDGTISGDSIDYALEGETYETPGSPILFRIVGGQALGHGDDETYDADSVSAPAGTSAVVASGSKVVFYVGQQGTQRRLALAEDLGAALRRKAVVQLDGFSDELEGLSGTEPTINIEDISVVGSGVDPLTDVQVALEIADEIALAAGSFVPVAEGIVGWTGLTAASVFGVGEPGTFDGVSVSAPSLLLGEGDSASLYYAGSDGNSSAIGLAQTTDGVSWQRVGETPVLSRGAAGAWDDAWVGHPSIVFEPESGVYHLWYVGSDGSLDRIGYATSVDGLEWTRHTDSSGISMPVFDGAGLPFALDGATRPSVTLLEDGFEMWFEGHTDGLSRLGRAWSLDGVNWTPVLNPTTAGDRFTIGTTRGDSDPESAIELGDDTNSPRIIDGYVVHGAGATEMILSPDGHHAVISNKRSPFLIVLDLHDDSTEDWLDANHNDIEAIIRVSQVHGMVGMRDLHFGPSGALWATMSPLIVPESSPADDPIRFGTEALIKLDWSAVVAEDLAVAEAYTDLVLSYSPLARGVEEDEGYNTDVSVAAGSMAMNAAGTRAYVANFNENSLYVMDLSAGARGVVKKAIYGLDENPWEVELSPDETLAFVGMSYGVKERGAQHSTIQVIDIDETSPTFGQVLTRLSNIESRSEHGCGL
jgi:hypothetical protein